jgi:hypothetical protein
LQLELVGLVAGVQFTNPRSASSANAKSKSAEGSGVPAIPHVSKILRCARWRRHLGVVECTTPSHQVGSAVSELKSASVPVPIF